LFSVNAARTSCLSSRSPANAHSGGHDEAPRSKTLMRCGRVAGVLSHGLRRVSDAAARCATSAMIAASVAIILPGQIHFHYGFCPPSTPSPMLRHAAIFADVHAGFAFPRQACIPPLLCRGHDILQIRLRQPPA